MLSVERKSRLNPVGPFETLWRAGCSLRATVVVLGKDLAQDPT